MKHKKSQHEGVRYPCDLCEHAARTLSCLKLHKDSRHDGVRYPCDKCKYAATQLSHLKSHKKRKHKEENTREPSEAAAKKPAVETEHIVVKEEEE